MTARGTPHLLEPVLVLLPEPALEALAPAEQGVPASLDISLARHAPAADLPAGDAAEPVEPVERGREERLLLAQVKKAREDEEAVWEGRGREGRVDQVRAVGAREGEGRRGEGELVDRDRRAGGGRLEQERAR